VRQLAERPDQQLIRRAETLPSQWAILQLFTQKADANCPFQFQKCSRDFIRSHHEVFSVIAVSVCNPDRVLFPIQS
jgi:hypothetical protein